MPVTIRRALVTLFNVDSAGNILRKNDPSVTIKQLTNFNTEHRIIEKTEGPAAAPNSSGNPDIDTYLQAEAEDEFELVYMDQYQIITQKVT
jgi:hypothetical protein